MATLRSLIRTPTPPATELVGGVDAARLDPVLRRLVGGGALALDDALRAQSLAEAGKERLPAFLARTGLVKPRPWAEAAAAVHGLQLVGADDLPTAPLLTDELSMRFLRNSLVLPTFADATVVWLAMVDPGDAAAVKAVKVATGRDVVPYVVAQDDLEQAFARLWDSGRGALQKIVDDIGEGGPAAAGDVEHLIDLAQEAPVVRLVNQLLTDAVRMSASDIHIEPYRDRLRVRFRVYGRLREIGAPPARLSAAVVSRIKILAKLDIAERRLPQDGRARMSIDNRRIDLRIATAPTPHGESLVIRLLDQSGSGVELAELGLDPDIERRLRRLLEAPHGMILVTGPTGSGKTTTLYAALRTLNSSSDKIISIEDPIEYQIDGVTQIHVRPDIGLDFARILRSVVRHDPDIIMVGETRDPETADIAVHAALTGHLLLTTLHTNNAAGAIARLLDMGVESYLLASVLRGIVGQRLVAVLCPACKRPHEATPEERALFAAAGIRRDGPMTLWQPVGCRECDEVGFVGRKGIFELLEVTDEVREQIRGRAPTQTILSSAIARGLRTMSVDGLHKALAGITTLEEVTRVTEDW
ncbi:MAG: GspE/PulE family protein [Geminicoccaceae bacterium]